MRVVASLRTQVAPAVVFAVVSDLSRYPDWLTIVPRADPVAGSQDGLAAWKVDLRARLGPLARSKRLRMVRIRCEEPSVVEFERQEQDGRGHGDWRLTAEVVPIAPDAQDGEATELRMSLRYEGRFANPVLERLLEDEIRRCKPRLEELLAAEAGID